MQKSNRIRQAVFLVGLTLALSPWLPGCAGDDDNGVINGPGGAISAVQVDRMAIAVVNTVLIPGNAAKDTFNLGDPASDAATWLTTASTTIAGLRAAVAAVPGFPPENTGAALISVSAAANLLIPDVITVNLANPTVFPNGRGLPDDAIDTALAVVLNRSGATDAINSNDVAFLPTFPYLAAPK